MTADLTIHLPDWLLWYLAGVMSAPALFLLLLLLVEIWDGPSWDA